MTPKGKYPNKEARSSDAGGDLNKQWVVEYYVWSEQLEKLVRKRVRISEPSAAERYKMAAGVIKEVNAALKSGVVVDALSKPVEAPVKSSVELNTDITLLKALDYFLELKKTTMKKGAFKTYRSCGNILREYILDKKLKNLKLTRFDSTQAFVSLDTKKARPVAKLYRFMKNYYYDALQIPSWVETRV